MNMKIDVNDCNCSGCGKGKGMMGCVYFLGFIGAAVYYISIASGFWVGVWGVIKALVWPAFAVYKLFQFLGI